MDPSPDEDAAIELPETWKKGAGNLAGSSCGIENPIESITNNQEVVHRFHKCTSMEVESSYMLLRHDTIDEDYDFNLFWRRLR